MTSTSNIPDTVEALIKLMVDSPEQVVIDSVAVCGGFSIRISVAETDVGKIIGKQGRTARALRTIINAMAMSAKQNVMLDIADGKQAAAV